MKNNLIIKDEGGFKNDEKNLPCCSPYHQPPMNLYIPSGKKYRHICPACGKVNVLRGSNIMF